MKLAWYGTSEGTINLRHNAGKIGLPDDAKRLSFVFCASLREPKRNSPDFTAHEEDAMLFMLLHDSDSPKCFGVGIWQEQHDETLRWGAKLSGILHHVSFGWSRVAGRDLVTRCAVLLYAFATSSGRKENCAGVYGLIIGISLPDQDKYFEEDRFSSRIILCSFTFIYVY